uniref:YLP motif-containing protein 1 n=1 Tax=Knipowitschia caucasica TaxID=637954 RepID=A0AAV2KD11_KNICA
MVEGVYLWGEEVDQWVEEAPQPIQQTGRMQSLQSALQKKTNTGMSGALQSVTERQHEIILKAAQELKLIRELQETNPLSVEPQPSALASDVMPELPAGLLGLEIPQDIKNVLKGIASQSTSKDPLTGDDHLAATDYQITRQSSVHPKTVDYAHGHEPGTTVEKISYGERIILRPDPVRTERGYEKESLSLGDPYSRDHYERRDPYLDRHEYSRERDYREKLAEREKYERYTLRDDRYREREREREVRERDHSGSRDRDHYGRSDYDRSSYKQASLERDRYSHGLSPQLERRSYEDRAPPAAPALPPAAPPSTRLDKKPELKNIDDILKMPGRLTRPDRIVIIMRGLPGSGKSHVAKLIRDKEVHCGGAPPRVIVLDDYFMTEVEKVEKDPDTGKRVKRRVLEYEYEPEMEETYRSSMLKTFKKTLDDGFFPFIILDTVNDRVRHFDQFWSAAKTKGFEVYLAEITADVQTCAKRNVHGRKLKDITKMANTWEPSPTHMVCLDVRSILQDAAIEEVEMEDFNPDDEVKQPKDEEESERGYLPKSKWEMDTSEAKLDRLDGLSIGGKRKRASGLEDFLQLPDDYATRLSQPGKKRVRWADLEEQKNTDLKRAIGFVVGQTDWERITDGSGQLAQKALNRTKYF